MSASPRPGSSWLGQNYDKLALATVLCLLLASAILLVSKTTRRKNHPSPIPAFRRVGRGGRLIPWISRP